MKKLLLLLVSFTILFLGGITNNVFSQNLVQNGGFEDETLELWTNLANDGGDAVYSIVSSDSKEGTNHMSVQVNTLGEKAWSVQSMSNNIDVVSGTTYNVELWAKSDVAGSSFKLVAQGGGDYHGNVIELTQEWTKYTWEFTVENTSSELQLKFQYKTIDTYHFDGVVVTGPSDPDIPATSNLLPSGGFEDAEAMWDSWAQGGGAASFSIVTDAEVATEGSNYMKIMVDTLGEKNYNIQTQTPTFQVVDSSAYEVSWWAKSDVEGATMNIYFTDPEGQQYGGKKTLTTDWVLYSKTWTAKGTGDCILKINWESLAEYHVDDFVILDPNFDPGLEPQTIDFQVIDDKFTTDDPFEITASATSGLPVTLSVVSGPATLDGNTVTLTGEPGEVSIMASQVGDDAYNPAVDVVQTFNVTIEGSVSMQTLEMDILYVTDPITIDGIAEEAAWSSAAEVAADSYFNDSNNEPDYYTENPTSDDLSASFKLLWSELGVYLYADITDDVIHSDATDLAANGKAHTYDNVEVFFHVPEADWGEELKASSDYVNTTFQLRSNIDIEGFWSGRSPFATDGGQGWVNGTEGKNQLDEYYEYEFASKDGGVTFEAFYPFEKLFGGSTASLPNRSELRSILFEFTYGDSDGSGTGGVRSGGIAWNSIADISDSFNGVAARDRTQFGKINLTSTIATSSDDIKKLDAGIKVYPTAFDDRIMIQSERKIIDVTLYNEIGMKVLHVHDNNGIERVSQLDALNAGFYFINMKTESNSTTVKLIKF